MIHERDMLEFDTLDFKRQINAVQHMIKRNAVSYVKTTARRVVRRLAWAAPQAKQGFKGYGRLRAGWWPAARALGINNIYTRYPNNEEGTFEDNLKGNNPSCVICNDVSYIGLLKIGNAWAQNAMNGVRAQMAGDLAKYARESWARRALIDDLTAE